MFLMLMSTTALVALVASAANAQAASRSSTTSSSASKTMASSTTHTFTTTTMTTTPSSQDEFIRKIKKRKKKQKQKKIRRSLQQQIEDGDGEGDENDDTNDTTPITTPATNSSSSSSSSCSSTVPLTQKYLLVEFLGYPRQLVNTAPTVDADANDPSNNYIEILENEFLVAYNIFASKNTDCISMTSSTILQDVVDNYFDSDTSDIDVDTTTTVDTDTEEFFPDLEQVDDDEETTTNTEDDPPPHAFSVLMVTDGFCTGCKDGVGSYFFSTPPVSSTSTPSPSSSPSVAGAEITNNNNLRRHRQRSLQQQTINNVTLFDPCSCRGPSVEDVVRQYAVQLSVTPIKQYISAVSGIAELEFMMMPDMTTTSSSSSSNNLTSTTKDFEECLEESQQLRTNFQTTVIVTVDLSSSPTTIGGGGGDDDTPVLLTNDQIRQLENLFIESYHACNVLNSNLCDSYKRRISSIVSAEVVATTSTATTTDIDTIVSITTIQDYDDVEATSSFQTLLLTIDVECVDCSTASGGNGYFDVDTGPVLFDRLLVIEEEEEELVDDILTTKDLFQGRQLMNSVYGSHQRSAQQQADDDNGSSTTAFVLDCLCPRNLDDSNGNGNNKIPIRSCSVDEFFDEYSSAMAGLTFPVSLVSVQEVRLTTEQPLCPTSVTEEKFTEVIILDLDLSKSCDISNSNDESTVSTTTTGAISTMIPSEEDFYRIEEAIVAAYNNLASFYCDPFYRFLRDANVTRLGDPFLVPSAIDTNETLILPVEVTVTGSCRNGCDPNIISIYDIPALSFVTNDDRKLTSISSLDDNILQDVNMIDRSSDHRLQEIENCYCASNPVGDRAPSEPEFVAALDSYLVDEGTGLASENTTFASSCVVSGVGECAFGELFESTILLTVNLENNTLSNSDEVQEFQSLLETSVLASLKQFYEISDQRCPLDARIILTVEAILDVIVFTPPLRDSDSILFGMEGGKRMLQFDANFNITVDNSNSTEGSEAPSESPTLFTEVTDLDEFDVALIVTGLCDGCESNALLVDDVSNRRKLGNLYWDNLAPNRFLQEMNDPVSLCFCPLDAEPLDNQPTFEEFQLSVQAQLEDNGSSAQIFDVKETDECEIDGNVGICPSGELSFECSNESTFTTTVVVDLQYTCAEIPDLDTLDFSELQQIADEYVASYNQLQVRVRL